MLSSRSHLALLLLLSRVVFNRRPDVARSVGRCPGGAPSRALALSVTDRISSCHKLRLLDSHNSVSHVSICICHYITPTDFRSTTWLVHEIDPETEIGSYTGKFENHCTKCHDSVQKFHIIFINIFDKLLFIRRSTRFHFYSYGVRKKDLEIERGLGAEKVVNPCTKCHDSVQKFDVIFIEYFW